MCCYHRRGRGCLRFLICNSRQFFLCDKFMLHLRCTLQVYCFVLTLENNVKWENAGLRLGKPLFSLFISKDLFRVDFFVDVAAAAIIWSKWKNDRLLVYQRPASHKQPCSLCFSSLPESQKKRSWERDW